MATNEKLVFRILNLFKETPKEVVRVQNMIKGSSLAAAIGTYFAGNPEITILIAGIGFTVDILLSCISIEKK